ncbi:scavenger receptor cysteine-rich domain superfamily protein-like [Anneissia japonica]|uniref:scavenger receptor cysteine-rich domain superfamily protein-like n=1 Tax=Anneissia japonica TaxID=1529436 RepID=UPI0014254F09|nr:scavenger receptor cysteine-rich domain superfamily protein-like [Anneissia japonica]
MITIYCILTALTLTRVAESKVCVADDDRYDRLFCLESFPDLNSLVRVKYRGEWYSICGKIWSKEGAHEVCMRHNHIGSYARNVWSEPAGDGTSKKLAVIDWICMKKGCSTCENCMNLIDREPSTTNGDSCNEVARVHCQDIRVTRNTVGPRSGLLEKYLPGNQLNKKWGTVCPLTWNISEANVACNQLFSCPAQVALAETKYRTSIAASLPINVRFYICYGHELSLDECVSKLDNTSCAEGDQRRAGLICRSNCARPIQAANVLIHPDRDDYAPNEHVYISCAPGYRSQFGETEKIICKENCRWDGPKIECKPVCDPPGEVQNGTFAPQQTFYYVGMSVNFTCQEHFGLNGFSKLTCREDGTWNRNLPECIGKCNKLYQYSQKSLDQPK